MNVHTFESSTEAYDASQGGDVKDGDVLHVPSEGVAAVLIGAWPVAVVGPRGAFHELAEGYTWATFEGGRYTEAANHAKGLV
jgi:hypothetical protein